MKPKRIILVRHGKSVGNADHSLYAKTPDYAMELTAEGAEQAKAAGQEIRAIIGNEGVYAYVSPYTRTRQTYQHIKQVLGEWVYKEIEDPRLREQEWGYLRDPETNGKIARERDGFGSFYYRIKDGESGADVYDRVTTFLDTLHRDFEKPDYPDNVLIVTHGMTLRLFLMRWFHWTVEDFNKIRNPRNCQVVVMEKQMDNRYILISKLSQRTHD